MRTIGKILTSTVLTFVACATGFATSASAGEQLTKQEFLEKANAICDARRHRTDAISARLLAGLADGESPSAAQIASLVERSLPSFRRSLAELDALDGPDALERRLDKVVAAYATAAQGIEADPVAFYEEPGELLFRPDTLARRIGVDCAGDYYSSA